MSVSQSSDDEKSFIHTVNEFQLSAQDVSQALALLEQWQHHLIKNLNQYPLQTEDLALNPNGFFYQKITAIHQVINALLGHWESEWQALAPMQQLAKAFEDKLILLVYGKFNAGKSSFCNFIAQRYQQQQLSTQYFQISAGQVLMSDEAFKEGITETTSQLQGVILHNKLVLIDTPGLHSSTPENADLTKYFTDSADGVLWLSSSASPGQVQELDELIHELKRRKPLLPVLTRSDFIEEDEVDGEIVKVLRNKTAENRHLQEQDVKQRAQEKLLTMGINTTQLKTPVSLSVHAAKTHTLREAGFDTLYSALIELINPVMAYKSRKSVEIVLHHFEETIIDSLLNRLLPQLDNLTQTLNEEATQLQAIESALIAAVWQQVIPLLPNLLEQHEATEEVRAVFDEASQHLRQALSIAFSQHAPHYLLNNNRLKEVVVTPDKPVSYERIVVEKIEVGISYEALYEELENLIYSELKQFVNHQIKQYSQTIEALLKQITTLRKVVTDSAATLAHHSASLASTHSYEPTANSLQIQGRFS